MIGRQMTKIKSKQYDLVFVFVLGPCSGVTLTLTELSVTGVG